MPVPNIDTFENDIRAEIKHREASVGEIASAGGTVANTSITPQHDTPMPKALLAFLIIAGIGIVGGFSYLAYVYLDSKPTPREEAERLLTIEAENQNTDALVVQKLVRVAPSFENIARFVSEVTPTPHGTAIKLKEHSPVFAFMLSNEQKLARETLAHEWNNYTGTSTLEITTTDETKSNQNMRVIHVASSTLVYAFFGEEYLAIASSTDNILRMRSAIIK